METWTDLFTTREKTVFLFWRSLLYNEERRLYHRHSITEVNNVIGRFLDLALERFNKLYEESIQAQE